MSAKYISKRYENKWQMLSNILNTGYGMVIYSPPVFIKASPPLK
jgi:hypothetical protein